MKISFDFSQLTDYVFRRQSEYDTYMRSNEWKSKRVLALKRALYRCQVCYSEFDLDVHHRTYDRFGHEAVEDLTVLCRHCHTLFHDARRLQRPPRRRKRRR